MTAITTFDPDRTGCHLRLRRYRVCAGAIRLHRNLQGRNLYQRAKQARCLFRPWRCECLVRGSEAGGNTASGTSTSSGSSAGTCDTPLDSRRPRGTTGKLRATTAPGGGAGKVWVNSASKVYHCPGDKWYGKTEKGSYMTEAAAKAQGDQPANNKTCS